MTTLARNANTLAPVINEEEYSNYRYTHEVEVSISKKKIEEADLEATQLHRFFSVSKSRLYFWIPQLLIAAAFHLHVLIFSFFFFCFLCLPGVDVAGVHTACYGHGQCSAGTHGSGDCVCKAGYVGNCRLVTYREAVSHLCTEVSVVMFQDN